MSQMWKRGRMFWGESTAGVWAGVDAAAVKVGRQVGASGNAFSRELTASFS